MLAAIRGQLYPTEQLEEAGWNGLLNELLPEIMPASSEENLYLWQVEIRRIFLWISLGLCTPTPEREFTLDPYVFLCHRKMN
jgi:hypothetical protein